MVGLKIKNLMEIKHVTQKKLSEKTGISSGAISSYLSGRYEPKFDKLQLIANALNVSVSVFLENNNNDPVTNEGRYVLENFREYLRDRMKKKKKAYVNAVSIKKVEMAAREAECFEILTALEDTLKATGWNEEDK